ncbi:hypothetical protein J2X72_003864 [Phyllobacterium sp. 1468]|nr:hypothetical protein [Phyllobacterium sp. 1468]
MAMASAVSGTLPSRTLPAYFEGGLRAAFFVAAAFTSKSAQLAKRNYLG